MWAVAALAHVIGNGWQGDLLPSPNVGGIALAPWRGARRRWPGRPWPSRSPTGSRPGPRPRPPSATPCTATSRWRRAAPTTTSCRGRCRCARPRAARGGRGVRRPGPGRVRRIGVAAPVAVVRGLRAAEPRRDGELPRRGGAGRRRRPSASLTPGTDLEAALGEVPWWWQWMPCGRSTPRARRAAKWRGSPPCSPGPPCCHCRGPGPAQGKPALCTADSPCKVGVPVPNVIVPDAGGPPPLSGAAAALPPRRPAPATATG
jgi:hypothetical protein